MGKQRNVKLSEYGISNLAYLELKYFCLQYPEKKEYIKKHNDRLEYMKDIKLIEETAKEVGGEYAKYIIDNAVYSIPFIYLPIDCCRRKFYNMRRMFFVKLYNKRMGIEK